ncbi:hypothetical protein A4G18_04275 [Pasteurellaceae bacterium Pebbles2]|nr:hypothetical protein [Pasteurellaceae bacterium Pebbles2]
MKTLALILSLLFGFINISYANQITKVEDMKITVAGKTYTYEDFNPYKNKNYDKYVKDLEAKTKALREEVRDMNLSEKPFNPDEINILIDKRNNLIKEIFNKKINSNAISANISAISSHIIDILAKNGAYKPIPEFQKRSKEIARFLGLVDRYYHPSPFDK